MPYKKFPLFKNNTNGNNADSIEANYEFIPNDKHVTIHCKRTRSFYVFDTCNEMVAFLVAQKKADPELLNYHEVIRSQSSQRLVIVKPCFATCKKNKFITFLWVSHTCIFMYFIA